MQDLMDRTLTILADGEPVTGYARARLIGTERLGLYPSLFMLHEFRIMGQWGLSPVFLSPVSQKAEHKNTRTQKTQRNGIRCCRDK
jgi:hypothetical protein